MVSRAECKKAAQAGAFRGCYAFTDREPSRPLMLDFEEWPCPNFTMAAETYLQRCAARYAAIRASPEGRRQSRRANLLAVALLVVGFPLALCLVGICEWLRWPRTTYVPLVLAAMVLISKAISGYVVNRIERGESQP